MIVYNATKESFLQDVYDNRIEEIIEDLVLRKMGRHTPKNEILSWQNSMRYMESLLRGSKVPDDAGVAIEYNIPQTSKRVDFILSGRDQDGTENLVIVELKQWSEATSTEKDGVVVTVLGGSPRETTHPSYQAWSYAALLEDFSETVREDGIDLHPCAYLHNCISSEEILAPCYSSHTEKAPSFLKKDTAKLRSFIEQFVRTGDKDGLMYRIDQSKIKPSKNLADALANMLAGNQEFTLIDDQKVVYENALNLSEKAQAGEKQVLIVRGGPGTGKSVVAINLLVSFTGREQVVHYVSKNSAPRAVYASKLTGTMRKSRIDNLFKGSGCYTTTDLNTFDVLVVDEAHRLNEKSGFYGNEGENQTLEIIRSAKCSVFFIDEDQRVTWKDTGRKAEIRKWAAQCGAMVTEMELASQFRCNGSDGYLAWLDHTLGIRETANTDLDLGFDFRVFDDPHEMRRVIEEKNLENNKARIVAGYCWNWVSKKQAGAMDIDIPEHDFRMQWNLNKDGSLWIIQPDSVKEAGCIHTCQGLEVDYVGVIIGDDLRYVDGELQTYPECRARSDASLKGYKKALKENPEAATEKADAIIRNTYRTLMTRGQKGCYIFCTDQDTAAYFKTALGTTLSAGPAIPMDPYPGLELRLLETEEIVPYENAVPVFNLHVAAGIFSEEQHLPDQNSVDWVALPEWINPQEGYFVTRVMGESMNRKIPNGSWCLFRLNPAGSREGKIVLIQLQDQQDPDNGRFTIKRYHSEKEKNHDQWTHSRIVLKPESTRQEYNPIILTAEDTETLQVVGEFVAVL
ncbi:DUF2075 domain-containing protein [Kiritimatiellota bacterium B12222]|nr:DUF2075 domain-containing protein [Kiritimatiellota bacterium B12222]